MNDKKDQLFAEPLAEIHQFEFDAEVVDVFPDMIKRSVPGYGTILNIIGQITERYAQNNSACYDLGCSLGAGILAMRHRLFAENTTIIGIDNAPHMITRCQQVIDADTNTVPVSLHTADITTVDFKPMSVCVLNFTLQFIEPAKRAALQARIADAMLPGGVLLLSEKLTFDDTEHDELMTDLHHNFKRINGYSDLEIAQKREAIDNVLIPESFSTHRKRLLAAGFRSADLWFQCFNFSSLIAFK